MTRDVEGARSALVGQQEAASDAAAIVSEPLRSAGADGWQTINTAPRDGSHVDLGYLNKRGRFYRYPDCYWHRKAKTWNCKYYDGDGRILRINIEPTHWMSLPAPPTSPTDTGEGT